MGKTKSRANGDGDVFPRKNKAGKITSYRGAYVGPDGKRRYVSGRTKVEARRALREARANTDQGLLFDADNLKVGEYLDRWLADSVSDTVKATTFERYEQITRLHLKPALGRVKLKALTPAHVRGLYREKLEAGSSARTVRYIHTTLHKALKQAVMDGLIPRNATEAVKPPQPSREEMHPLTPEQAKLLLQVAHESRDRLEALYVLAIHTGLRQGELLGLKWDDVDLDDGSLQVRRTLAITKNGSVFTSPKTSGSRRSVKLTQRATEALRSHLERQLGEIDRGGLALERERPHIRFRDGRTPQPTQPHPALVQAAPEAGGATGHPFPRPPPHVRHAAPHPQCEPEDSVRDARTFVHSHYPRHLFPRAAEHAGPGRSSDGRGSIVAYCCRIAAKAPGNRVRGLSAVCVKVLFCRNFTSRGGGTRTHTPYKDPDFKSGASADSATPPGFGREYNS
jgi:integrase